MQTSLQAIAEKAKEDDNYRFQDLYRMLDANLLKEAWKKLNKKAAPGIDGITAEDYAKDLESNIQATVEELKGKRYHAKLVKQVNIPKGDGRLRPLGLLVMSDKVVQRGAADILEAIYEQDFLPCSYGYRPNLGPGKAVKDLDRELQFGRYNYVVEADIRSYFNNIDHGTPSKLGDSCTVKVRVGQGLTSHPYRVLRLVLVTAPVKCTQSTMWAVRETVHPLSNSAPLDVKVQVTTWSWSWKSIQKDRNGKIREGLPGSKSMARIERNTRNLGGPGAPAVAGRNIRNESQVGPHAIGSRTSP